MADIIDLHKKSSNHKEEVMASNLCSCFYCLRTFDPATICEWIDANTTALCPHCGIDSVLPGEIDKQILRDMSTYWFSYEI